MEAGEGTDAKCCGACLLHTDPTYCGTSLLPISKFGSCGPCASNPTHLLAPRPEVPPLEELPGPGAATFSGLDAYIRLMEDCWAQEPQDRPTFEDVVPRLRWDGLHCCSTRYPCIQGVSLRRGIALSGLVGLDCVEH